MKCRCPSRAKNDTVPGGRSVVEVGPALGRISRAEFSISFADLPLWCSLTCRRGVGPCLAPGSSSPGKALPPLARTQSSARFDDLTSPIARSGSPVWEGRVSAYQDRASQPSGLRDRHRKPCSVPPFSARRRQSRGPPHSTVGAPSEQPPRLSCPRQRLQFPKRQTTGDAAAPGKSLMVQNQHTMSDVQDLRV